MRNDGMEALKLAGKYRALTNVFLVMFSIVLSGAVFLVGDFFFGNFLLPPSVQSKDRPIQNKKLGWYGLKPEFSGFDQFGPRIFPVETDSFGFRKAIGTPASSSYDTIFLGDSFTYGVNGEWEETFVGMYAKASGQAVLNTGVSSYSPTAYVFQYEKALSASLLKPSHTVIVGVDISDVQDEAGIWVDGETHPERLRAALDYQSPPEDRNPRKVSGRMSLRILMRENLPLTRAIYRYFRRSQSGFAASDWPPLDRPRSAFTHADWTQLDQEFAYVQESGYAPLGVQGGLDRIEMKLGEITEIARKQGADVYFLIYPWPAQLNFTDDKFDWSGFMQENCRQFSCSGVIDVIPRFRTLASKIDDWYEAYFIVGDVHFNEAGNRVIAEELLKELAQN